MQWFDCKVINTHDTCAYEYSCKRMSLWYFLLAANLLAFYVNSWCQNTALLNFNAGTKQYTEIWVTFKTHNLLICLQNDQAFGTHWI